MSSLTQSLVSFLNDRGIGLDGLHGIGFDPTNTLYGESSAVQKRLWNNAPVLFTFTVAAINSSWQLFILQMSTMK